MSPFAVWWAVSDTVAVLAPPQSLRRTPMHINSIYVCAYILLYHDVRVVSGHGLIVFAMVYQCSVLCACDVTRNLQAAVDGVQCKRYHFVVSINAWLMQPASDPAGRPQGRTRICAWRHVSHEQGEPLQGGNDDRKNVEHHRQGNRLGISGGAQLRGAGCMREHDRGRQQQRACVLPEQEGGRAGEMGGPGAGVPGRDRHRDPDSAFGHRLRPDAAFRNGQGQRRRPCSRPTARASCTAGSIMPPI